MDIDPDNPGTTANLFTLQGNNIEIWILSNTTCIVNCSKTPRTTGLVSAPRFAMINEDNPTNADSNANGMECLNPGKYILPISAPTTSLVNGSATSLVSGPTSNNVSDDNPFVDRLRSLILDYLLSILAATTDLVNGSATSLVSGQEILLIS